MTDRAREPDFTRKAMRNVVLSYMRDGYPKWDAAREARKWRARMEQRRAERMAAASVEISPCPTKSALGALS